METENEDRWKRRESEEMEAKDVITTEGGKRGEKRGNVARGLD